MLHILLQFPIIKPGYKVCIKNNKMVIDTSLTVVRTILSILQEGYTRGDMITYLKCFTLSFQQYIEYIEHNTIYNIYRLKNMEVYQIIDSYTRELLHDVHTAYCQINRICTSLNNLKICYTGDVYTTEQIQTTHHSLDTGKHKLHAILTTFRVKLK